MRSLVKSVDCVSLEQLRTQLDLLDKDLADLLALRLEYVARAKQLKQEYQALYDKQRTYDILNGLVAYTQQVNYPSTIIVTMFRYILKCSLDYMASM